jgi:hypothetical protein
VVELPVLAVELELPIPEEPEEPLLPELPMPEETLALLPAPAELPVLPGAEAPELDEPEPERPEEPEPEAPEPPTLEEPGAPEPEPPPLCARTGRAVKASAPAMHAPARMR